MQEARSFVGVRAGLRLCQTGERLAVHRPPLIAEYVFRPEELKA